MLDLNLATVDGLLPDRTFLLLLDPRARARARGDPDRIEREGDRFLARVDDGYRSSSSFSPSASSPLDASPPADELAAGDP